MTDRQKCRDGGRGTPLTRLRLGAEELNILAIARHYFSSFAAPERQGWLAAISASLDFAGHDKGPHRAMAVLSTVQGMRRCRMSCFRFKDPNCPGCSALLTDHERLFLNTINALAMGQREAAMAHALLLCEGNDAAPFLDAAEVLVEVCGLRKSIRTPPPSLRAARLVGVPGSTGH